MRWYVIFFPEVIFTVSITFFSQYRETFRLRIKIKYIYKGFINTRIYPDYKFQKFEYHKYMNTYFLIEYANE